MRLALSESHLPERYSQRDLDNARTKGQIVGWLQGGAVVLAGTLLLGVIGWLPTLAALGIGGFVAYKLLSRPSKRD